VVFSDGSEFLNTPVWNWDLMGDLAVLGPIQTTISTMELVDREDLIIGSDTFLIGYPGEVEEFPQPTITRGLISRLREWEPIGMTYFQTDATIASGQSGGVLVSEQGEVIGISGFSFTEAAFGVVASAADISPRVMKLIAGEDVAGLGDRRIPQSGGQRDHKFTLDNFWDEVAFVIDQPVGSRVDLKVSGDNDMSFTIYDSFGNELLYIDEELDGPERGSIVIDFEEPYFLVVGHFTDKPGDFIVESNRDLIRYEDADDGRELSIGQTLIGNIDYPDDLDYYVMRLDGGKPVSISVDSVLIDGLLSVDFRGASSDDLAIDDDSGGGLFGLNPELIYEPLRSRKYFIVVGSAVPGQIGGYFISVERAN